MHVEEDAVVLEHRQSYGPNMDQQGVFQNYYHRCCRCQRQKRVDAAQVPARGGKRMGTGGVNAWSLPGYGGGSSLVVMSCGLIVTFSETLDVAWF